MQELQLLSIVELVIFCSLLIVSLLFLSQTQGAYRLPWAVVTVSSIMHISTASYFICQKDPTFGAGFYSYPDTIGLTLLLIFVVTFFDNLDYLKLSTQYSRLFCSIFAGLTIDIILLLSAGISHLAHGSADQLASLMLASNLIIAVVFILEFIVVVGALWDNIWMGTHRIVSALSLLFVVVRLIYSLLNVAELTTARVLMGISMGTATVIMFMAVTCLQVSNWRGKEKQFCDNGQAKAEETPVSAVSEGHVAFR